MQPETTPLGEPTDPVIIDAVEATQAEDVIALPGPVPADLPPAAGLETVEATPAVGEAPAEIDEVVPSMPAGPVSAIEADIAAQTEAEAAAETNEGGIAPAEPLSETEAEIAAETEAEAEAVAGADMPEAEPVGETAIEIDAETAAEAEAETNEGGIAPAEGEAEPVKKPPVPPVVPEPKS